MPATEQTLPSIDLAATQALEGPPAYPLDDPAHPLHGWDTTVGPVLALLSVPLVLWRIGVFFERARIALKGPKS